ncbi:MAG: UDP-glucose/GDP-mannose dehydrogenase family protein [Candidatus Omnitrophica bacterium]|nr:UDP-glucose/GDP-mannose dehydrogenase family protein [Candidatus Omnitrophota bacterium]
MQNIGIVGTGYVGLVTAAVLADLGNKVICEDCNYQKIEDLKKGIIPIYEPGLQDKVLKNIRAKRLKFSHRLPEVVKKSKIIFICVGTPPRKDGSADLSSVENVARKIAQNMKEYKIIVSKSTVPVQTGEWVKRTVSMLNPHKVEFSVVSNPEFLREGRAIEDSLHPDRIVIGVEDKKAERTMRQLFKPIRAPILVTDIKTAEIIKHASNSFLATKISFINAVANICEKTGADVNKVAEGMGLDKRIGRAFLRAGVGFGGFCFPKDLSAFIYIAKIAGYDFELLNVVQKINETQKQLLVKKIEQALWIIRDKTIGILGLSFKPDTDDIRFAPALDIIKILRNEGAKIKVYDPKAMRKVKKELKYVKLCQDPYEVAKNCDCLVIMTEWDEFKEMDLRKVKRLLRQPIIIDGRNIFEPAEMHKLGFIYKGIGR